MSFKIETEVVFPGLVHFTFDTQYEVSSTMMRLQEFYESPFQELKSKYFTLETIMDRYAKHTGNFSYTSDWSGFNVPGDVVEQFYELFGEKMLDKEYDLFDIIGNVTSDWNKFYVIASSKDGGKRSDQSDVMKHEIAHGLWYLNSDYNKEQRKIVRIINQDHVEIGEKLIKMGYCEQVLDDEIHAYLATSSMTYLADDGFEGCDIPWELVLKAQRIFEKYYEKVIGNE